MDRLKDSAFRKPCAWGKALWCLVLFIGLLLCFACNKTRNNPIAVSMTDSIPVDIPPTDTIDSIAVDIPPADTICPCFVL
jgi:hypothetical protein